MSNCQPHQKTSSFPRRALGALIIKEKLGTSDRETVEQIRENPYLQYILGLSAYSNEAPFEASMLVHFRARIGVNLINQVNKKMVSNQGELTGFQRGEKKPEKEGLSSTLCDNFCLWNREMLTRQHF